MNMKNQELQQILNAKHRGAYFTMTWHKTYGDYSRTTTSVFRLADYAKVAKKEPKAVDNSKPSTKVHLGNNVYYNTNTGNTTIMVFGSKNPKHHSKSVYYHLDEIIDKDEFISGSGHKPSKPSEIELFTINIADIISIG